MFNGTVDELISRAKKSKSEVRQQEVTARRDRTILKYQETEGRLQEIDKKILRLQEERDNLLRKQKSRKTFLESLNGK